MEDQNPLVSIIMLTYNRAKYISAAIESVINQNFANWELLIVDGGSRDNTENIISKYLNDPRIKYHKLENNMGLTGNRNQALKLARGKYIAVLDSDDVWISDEKLGAQVKFLEENKNYVLVGTNFERIDESGRRLEKVTVAITDQEIRNNILLRNEFAHSSVIFLKEKLQNTDFLPESVDPKVISVYDPSLFIWEDYDLWLRLGLLGKMANLPEFMTAYRKHTGSISGARKIKGALTNLKIIKRYKKFYPHYFKAWLKGWFRVLARAIGF
ncbi:MAG TPA: glycosyltransferase family 2 protein [Candidatus Paceibacterota bacterium]|nr:glycosyltransferase family 2 protein [Candidatus Paceibacterota bacterium]